ncbi:Histone-lysine N-methyltransferase ehmt2 [Phlyctochytrium bullatum]|nr:Histone-lysine N-methyltransferase ehmt2 [Phlyctochytrium bullatum]
MALTVQTAPSTSADNIPTTIYSLPVEVLLFILKLADPRLLPTLASVSRELRFAVNACLDFDLAKHQLVAAGYLVQNYHQDPREYPYHPSGTKLVNFPFDHPFLLHHTVVVFNCCGLGYYLASTMWGDRWSTLAKRPEENREKIRLHRVQALRLAVQKGLWPLPHFDKFEEELDYAFKVAGYFKSVELVEDLQRKFPERIMDDLHVHPLRSFFLSAAEVAFMDALRLIPAHHPILSMTTADKYYEVMLLQAIKSRDSAAVQLLIELGSPVNATFTDTASVKLNYQFEAPLHYAIYRSTFEIVQMLLDHGADAKITNSGGLPAIHFAVRRGRHDVFQLLMQRGADPNALDSVHRCTALHYAMEEGNMECIRGLLDAHVNVNARNIRQETPLNYACKHHHRDAMKLLIQHGARVEASHVFSALTEPRSRWDGTLEETLKILLDNGAPVDAVDADWKTPLYHTLSNNWINAAITLMDYGACPFFKVAGGDTILHIMVQYCCFDYSQLLLDRLVERGINLNAQDLCGHSPLHMAALMSDWDALVWFLRREQVDRDLLNKDGSRWVDLLVSYGDERDVKEQLLKHAVETKLNKRDISVIEEL